MNVDESEVPTLRDLIKLKDILQGNFRTQLSYINSICNSPSYKHLTELEKECYAVYRALDLTYCRSFASISDQKVVGGEIRRILNVNSTLTPQNSFDVDVLSKVVRIRSAYISTAKHKHTRKTISDSFVFTENSVSHLELLVIASQSGRPVLLLGDTSVGKTTLISEFASLVNQELVVIPMSDSTVTSDFIGQWVLHEASTLQKKYEQLTQTTKKEIMILYFELTMLIKFPCENMCSIHDLFTKPNILVEMDNFYSYLYKLWRS